MINEYKKNPTVPGPDERYVSDEVNIMWPPLLYAHHSLITHDQSVSRFS